MLPAVRLVDAAQVYVAINPTPCPLASICWLADGGLNETAANGGCPTARASAAKSVVAVVGATAAMAATVAYDARTVPELR